MTLMSSGSSDGSVIIAGLGLRLGPVPAEPRTTHIPEGIAGENRVFVTELVSGGAAERSNLLRLNDEILHVDHTSTSPSRTVVSPMLRPATSQPNGMHPPHQFTPADGLP